MGFVILTIVVALILVILIAKYIRVVPQAHVYIVERLGAYKQTMGVGMHILMPVVDRVAKKVSLKEQVLDFKPQKVITKDNVTMSIDAVVYYQVTDAKLFTYAVEQPMVALENLTATTLRNIIGTLELDETLSSRDKINADMQSTIDEATDPWGIKVKRVEIKDIQPPKTILESMEKQMKAERDRRETILEAEGHKESVVMRADGDKRAKVLKAEAERDAQIALAEGKAKSIKAIYEAEAEGLKMLKDAGIDESVLSIKKIEALKTLADGNATKLIIPTELAGIASILSAGADIAKIGDGAVKEKVTEKKESDVCCDKEEHGKLNESYDSDEYTEDDEFEEDIDI